MDTYTVGTQVQLNTTFANSAGSLVDPDTVTGEVLLPDGTTEDLDVVKQSTGVYYALFTPAQNGLHQYRFAGVGTLTAANESFFMAQTVFPTE